MLTIFKDNKRKDIGMALQRNGHGGQRSEIIRFEAICSLSFGSVGWDSGTQIKYFVNLIESTF